MKSLDILVERIKQKQFFYIAFKVVEVVVAPVMEKNEVRCYSQNTTNLPIGVYIGISGENTSHHCSHRHATFGYCAHRRSV